MAGLPALDSGTAAGPPLASARDRGYTPPVIVCKFGGSSVDGAAGIARVAGILRARLDARPVVVVSAMAKTTRRLLDSAEAAAAGNLAAALAGCDELYAFHAREAEAALPAAAHARLAALLANAFGELRALLARLAWERTLSPRDADAAAAWGEVLASEILALALPRFGIEAAWIDARRLLVTDDIFTRAQPLYDETGERLRAALPPIVERGAVPVVGGYIGATRDGAVTTLGKEGSDFSAAIIGAALGAAEVQIWTDVDGILTADPRLVPGARLVRTLSFAESLELACSGAKKPHPGTLVPAARAGVPIRVLNTLDGRGPGTMIGRRNAAAPAALKSMACRPNDCLLHVSPGPAGGGEAFAGSVLAAVERLRPALLVLRLDAAGADLALDRSARLEEARAALAAAGETGVLRGRAVISLVSEDLATDGGLAARTLAAATAWLPRLVTAGAAAPAVRCLAELEDLPAAAADLHRRLFPGGAGDAVE
jgi:aspartate kinase